MSNKTLRYLIVSVVAMLLVAQVGALVMELFGMVWGGVAAVVVLVVAFFSVRQAGVTGHRLFWIFLPILLFLVCPVIYRVWRIVSDDVGWLDRLVKLAPFMVGFAIPVVVLLLVYHELRKREVDRG